MVGAFCFCGQTVGRNQNSSQSSLLAAVAAATGFAAGAAGNTLAGAFAGAGALALLGLAGDGDAALGGAEVFFDGAEDFGGVNARDVSADDEPVIRNTPIASFNFTA